MNTRFSSAASLTFVALLTALSSNARGQQRPFAAGTVTLTLGPAGTTTIDIVGVNGAQSFSPNPASVGQGQTFIWKNRDGATHRIVLDDGSLDTGDISPGASSAPIPVPINGGNYHCSIHPSMVGTITVSAPASAMDFEATKTATSDALTDVTPAQAVTVSFSGTESAWMASADQSWVQLTSSSGSGNGQFTVAIVNPNNVIGGSTSLSATITVTAPAASNSPASLSVVLTVHQTAETIAAPFGSFDTPVAGAQVQGSIAVTGWALDNLEVDRVEIWRDLVAGETTIPFNSPGHPGHGKVFIATPLFVTGARPDVEAAYPGTPFKSRAGWGYLLLTWGLPNQGNGPFTLYAFAFDKEGHATTLGVKAITASNSTATKPFGSIDVPAYGQTTTTSFWNYGWALTPNATPTCSIVDGNVSVSIDSGPLIPVTYGGARTDIASAFPGFSNASSAGGAYYLDLTTVANGTHSIGWLVVDSCGRAEGIGSRFFTVAKSSLATENGGPPEGGHYVRPDDGISTRDIRSVRLQPDRDAVQVVEVAQDERVELQLPMMDGATYTGAQIVNGELRALPIGSSLDAATGIFYWQPAAGFLGRFDLEFGRSVRLQADRETVHVRVVVGPSMRMAIDTPQGGGVTEPLVVAGWAIDLAAPEGSGIDTVHVWAYPTGGGAPIFLGVAAVGDSRPDVAATYGAQFEHSAYSLTAGGLAPGTYDLVVYPHRIVTGTFDGAQIVRVTIR